MAQCRKHLLSHWRLRSGTGARIFGRRALAAHGHRQVYLLRACHGVGQKAYALLGEVEETVFAHPFAYESALVVEHGQVEVCADFHRQRHRVGVDVSGNLRLLEIIGYRPDGVRFSGPQEVFHVDFSPARRGGEINAGIVIAGVDQRLAQLARRLLGQGRVEYHRFLADFAQPAVEAARGVASGKVVDTQLQLGEAEHAVVGSLPQVVVEAFGSHVAAVGHTYRGVIEQIAPFRHKTRGAARAQGQCSNQHQYYACDFFQHGVYPPRFGGRAELCQSISLR